MSEYHSSFFVGGSHTHSLLHSTSHVFKKSGEAHSNDFPYSRKDRPALLLTQGKSNLLIHRPAFF